MEFRLLGALEAEEDGRLLRCRGRRERALLVLLLLPHANEPVSRQRPVEELWRGAPAAECCRSAGPAASRARGRAGRRARGRSSRLIRDADQVLAARA